MGKGGKNERYHRFQLMERLKAVAVDVAVAVVVAPWEWKIQACCDSTVRHQRGRERQYETMTVVLKEERIHCHYCHFGTLATLLGHCGSLAFLLICP